MIEGKTKSGFHFEVPKDRFDDMELVDTLVEMAEDNPLAVSRVLTMVLGEEQRRKLYEHLREAEGRVRVTAVMAAVEDIFEAFTVQGKNS